MKTNVRRAPAAFEAGFESIRKELGVPPAFPEAVLDAAQHATPAVQSRVDARHLNFIAIDPPGATDLDQAFCAESLGSGFRVFYAIADVGAFVPPGGAVDEEARRRGTTLYSPDGRTPLHPPILSEDRASLLPGVDRLALLWTIDLDEAGLPTRARLERAEIRVREAIPYTEAQRRIDRGDPAVGRLRAIGKLREDQQVARGGVSLNLPSQEIREHDGHYTLEYDESLPVENWNAQISLLAGIVAGEAMQEAGVGILRVLPPTKDQDLRRLRRQAQALGVSWPESLSYSEMIRATHPRTPAENAFLIQAARSFRGAGYVGFDGELPDAHQHGAIAATYSHVTAPLRRLVDRFGNEILLSIYADERPPAWALETLEQMPKWMARAKSRASALDRATLDFAETLVLAPFVGERFDAFVVDLNERRDRAVVQIKEPAIVAQISSSGRHLAEEVALRLESVDSKKRRIDFEPF